MPPFSLIAEENSSVYYLLKTYAQMSGFQTIHASVGESVVEMVHQYHPALILLNINLPGSVRGWEVLKSLKDDQRTRSIPIIIYDAGEQKQDRQDIRRAEADAYLPMPVLYECFKATLVSIGMEIHQAVSAPTRNIEKAERDTRSTEANLDLHPTRRSKRKKYK